MAVQPEKVYENIYIRANYGYDLLRGSAAKHESRLTEEGPDEDSVVDN